MSITVPVLNSIAKTKAYAKAKEDPLALAKSLPPGMEVVSTPEGTVVRHTPADILSGVQSQMAPMPKFNPNPTFGGGSSLGTSFPITRDALAAGMGQNVDSMVQQAGQVRNDAYGMQPAGVRGPNLTEILGGLALLLASGDQAGDVAQGMYGGYMQANEMERGRQADHIARAQQAAEMQARGIEQQADLADRRRTETLGRMDRTNEVQYSREVAEAEAARRAAEAERELRFRAEESEKNRRAAQEKVLSKADLDARNKLEAKLLDPATDAKDKLAALERLERDFSVVYTPEARLNILGKSYKQLDSESIAEYRKKEFDQRKTEFEKQFGLANQKYQLDFLNSMAERAARARSLDIAQQNADTNVHQAAMREYEIANKKFGADAAVALKDLDKKIAGAAAYAKVATADPFEEAKAKGELAKLQAERAWMQREVDKAPVVKLDPPTREEALGARPNAAAGGQKVLGQTARDDWEARELATVEALIAENPSKKSALMNRLYKRLAEYRSKQGGGKK